MKKDVRQSPVSKSSALSMNSSVSKKSCCVWCREAKQPLKYILPTQHGNKEFCSEVCLAEFRRAYNKGACGHCDNVIRGPPIRLEESTSTQLKEFCSTECLAKFQSPSATKHNSSEKPEEVNKKQKYSAEANFSWARYMEEAGGVPAPLICFNQPQTPPQNNFKPGMKLEAVDPRNTTSTCIATVIGSIGPRLRLRLDGSDNTNDFYRLIDSSDIAPFNHCEANGGMLQPPLGFRMNASFWPMFLLKTLPGSEMAPEHCFGTWSGGPKGNYFKVGMKLEAVDRKQPHLVCVATVGAINGESLHVTFDGWRGAFDYWTKYDSRDLFPVNWASSNSHPLEPPGLHVLKPILVASSPSVTVNINKTCVLGPYLNRKRISDLSTTYGPSEPGEMLQNIIQLLLDSSNEPISHYLKQGQGKPVQAGRSRLKLVLVENVDQFWEQITSFLRNITCCDGLVSVGPCGKCEKTGLKRLHDDAADEAGVKKVVNSSRVTKIVNVPHNTSPSPTTNTATTTTPSQSNNTSPSDWSVEQVIKHIISSDVSLAVHGESFRKHEIDGKAMLLLTSDMMMNYMGLKLGPALKICNNIQRYKSGKRFSNGTS